MSSNGPHRANGMPLTTSLFVIDSPLSNEVTKWRVGAMRGPHCIYTIYTKHLNSTKDIISMQHVGF